MSHFYLFILFGLGYAQYYCDTFDGPIYNCECCVSSYPYDECYDYSYCEHILVWIISFWVGFWVICFAIYMVLYCRSKSQLLRRMELIRNRANESQAIRQAQVGQQRPQEIPQQFEVTNI